MSGKVKMVETVRVKTRTEIDMERLDRKDRQIAVLRWLLVWFVFVVAVWVVAK